MEGVSKRRSVTRRSFTKTYKEIETLMADMEVKGDKYAQIRAKLLSLEELHSELKRLDDELLYAMLEDSEEKEIEKEMEDARAYHEKWLLILEKIKLIEADLKNNTKTGEVKRNFKLPHLELKKFDGNLKNWLPFWGQYKKIHEDVSIDNDDKHQYLQMCMETQELKSLVESYQPCNYKQCIEEIKKRYAKEELLIQIYVRELLALILIKTELDLTTLYDKMNAQLRALESLGVTKEKYSAFILPMVESALPQDILKVWERNTSHTNSMEDELNNLLSFLQREVESDQRIILSKNTFMSIHKDKEESGSPVASASSLFTVNNKEDKKFSCIWCDKSNHNSTECYKIYKMTLEQRKQHLKNKKVCSICFKTGHFFKTCKAFVKCFICQKRHQTILCPEQKTSEEKTSKVTSTNASSASQGSTMLQTVVVEVEHKGKKIPVRALYDSGSQRTYIKQDVVDKLGMSPDNTEILSHSLFGGVETKSRELKSYNVTVKSLDHCFEIDMIALSQDCICSNVPKVNLKDKKLSKLLHENNIKLTDKGDISEIGLLIGADFSGFLSTGTLIQLENGLVAFKTRLGWALQGKQVGVNINNTSTTTLTCINNDILTGYWSLETLGIQDPAAVKSKETAEAEVLAAFEENITTNSEGRYEVQLPFKAGYEDLLSNYDVAKTRLGSTTKKLVTCGKFDDYNAIFEEWQSLGIIEKVPVPEIQHDKGHYLPHRPVIKESSLTSALRPVFDASATAKNGLSLNNCLEKGCNFIDLIPNLLIGFRRGAIGVTSDIAKAFLQISVPTYHRNYLKFLWWEDASLEQIIEYRHCRVVFGLTSSPFLLSATLIHHLNSITGEYQNTAQHLKRSMYVDNCLTSLDTEEDTRRFIAESKHIMSEAKFNLRLWVTSPLPINETGKQEISVLGLNWDTASDQLSCNTKSLPTCEALEKVTKRQLLSITQKVFDPIGYTAPVMLIPKLILRETCQRKLAWDNKVPSDLLHKFKEWYKYITYLNDCKIPRRLSAEILNKCEVSLQLFCDASKDGYGACVLLRAEKENKVTVQMIAAKAKVAPPEKVTIPRLELLAALIGSRLLASVRESLALPNCPEYCWTDSGVTLCWIKRELPLNTYVGNRIKEIRKHTNINNWHHIPGEENWADLASRGCNAKNLLHCRWWEGPAWLQLAPEEWPHSELVVDERQVNLETKKTVCSAQACSTESLLERIQNYFSNYTKVVRMTAWILRFIYNAKNINNKRQKEITYNEYNKAEKLLIKLIQRDNNEYLEKANTSLTQYKDSEGIIRVKTKLILSSEFSETVKLPYLLPAKNQLVVMMVRERHVLLQHAGADCMITDLRTRFWIVGIRRLVKTVIFNCIVCKRHKSRPVQAPTAPLPTERLEGAMPFQTTGVDLAGPLYLNSGDKCWIVLFTCAVYRAVHLELIKSLSTEAFIMSLRRFIARRGRSDLLMSDNGTNFVGTKNLLNSLDWEELQRQSTIRRFAWKMNAPTAAWWGGFWERLIRVMKELLRRILGNASVSYDELQTLMCDCEATMNGRPLTYVNDDKGECLEPLTPAHFIQPMPVTDVSDLDQIDATNLNRRLQYLHNIREQFRNRFKTEYLTLLVQRGKEKKDDLNIGDIVLIVTEEKRIKWPLGVVIDIMKGKDEIGRTVRVRTAMGLKVRPVQKLYKLEVSSGDSISSVHSGKSSQVVPPTNTQTDMSVRPSEQDSQRPLQCTRSGRSVKLPSKYNLYV